MRKRPVRRLKLIRNRRIILLSAGLVILLAVIAGIVVGVRALLPQLSKLPFLPNYQVVDFHTYFALEPDVMGIIIEDTRVTSEQPPIMENGIAHLPASFVKEYMDPFIFWDENARALYVTTYSEVMQFMPGAVEYRVNDEKQAIQHPISANSGVAYLPASLVSLLYPYDLDYQPEHNMLIITERGTVTAKGRLIKNADIRYRPDAKAPIAQKALKDEMLYLYKEDGDFTRVRTGDGLLGYVLTSLLEPSDDSDSPAATPDKGIAASRDEAFPLLWPEDVKINLMWDPVYVEAANDTLMAAPIPDGVNVISPTWFTFNESSFDVVSLGRRAYVDWAHGQGVSVWALVKDETSAISHGVLSSAAQRKRVVSQLVSYMDELGLDGINVDFEHVKEEDGEYYIQFLRELAVAVHGRNKILSVDVYVPSAWSAFYRRDMIGKTADFVCVMTYDEYYAGSPTSGPVASLRFVFKGVEDMLLEVPKEKLLMGLPYYNRIWRELVNEDSPETRNVQHYGMERTKALFVENGVTPEWDPMAGSYYGEYAVVEDGETVLYRIWLEDEHSIAEKLKIFESNDLAGVAGWYRGLENEAVQALLREACK